MLYLGGGVFVFCYLYMSFMNIMADRLTMKLKIAYLRAILKQECSWFDEVNTNEMSSRLSKEAVSINRALGEKMGFIVWAFAMSISGFGFAIYRGWLLSLILLGAVPLLGGIGIYMTKAASTGYEVNMKAYSQSAGYAEQAIVAIKVVHAYGMEISEQENYVKYLNRAKVAGVKSGCKSTFGIAAFQTGIMMYYGYSFTVGKALMLSSTIKNGDQPYTGADVLACLIGIIFGIFAVGGSVGNFKSIVEGKAAGGAAFEVIDRTPKIDLNDPKMV